MPLPVLVECRHHHPSKSWCHRCVSLVLLLAFILSHHHLFHGGSATASAVGGPDQLLDSEPSPVHSTRSYKSHNHNDTRDEHGLIIHPDTEATVVGIFGDRSELPIFTSVMRPALTLAVQEANRRFPHLRFKLIMRDTGGCQMNHAGAVAAEEYYLNKVMDRVEYCGIRFSITTKSWLPRFD